MELLITNTRVSVKPKLDYEKKYGGQAYQQILKTISNLVMLVN